MNKNIPTPTYNLTIYCDDTALYTIQKSPTFTQMDSEDTIEIVVKDMIKDSKERVIRHIDKWLEAFTGKSFIEELNTFQSEIPDCEKTVFQSKFEFPIYFYNLLLKKYTDKLKIVEYYKEV